jgi:hypothetical protein
MAAVKEEKPRGRPKRVTRPPAWLTMADEPARKDAAKAPRSRKRKVLPAQALLVTASRADPRRGQPCILNTVLC